MSVEEFLELFIKELEQNEGLRQYYRLLNSKKKYLWRKAYLEQRLEYISNKAGSAPGTIWDVGCGYGTTAIFLAINGFTVRGNTLEFYYNQIESRLKYWSRYGNLDKLSIEYANLYDMDVPAGFFDAIIAQDTLHHLEPIDKAIQIFSGSLKPGGKLIVTEENGLSIFIRMKNFSKRGFKRISEYHDERLQKTIPFGNENARSVTSWKNLLNDACFDVPGKDIEFIRLYPHFIYNPENYMIIREKENILAKKLPPIHEYLFFGINFTAIQNVNRQQSGDFF